MAKKEVYKSVPGILRPFKEYLLKQNLAAGDQIVYYGCVGTCTPFIELLAVAVRGLNLQQVFVPLLEETKARTINNVEDVGMQVNGEKTLLQPKIIVFMGGLAMPNVPVTKDQVKALVTKHGDVKVIGVCFMNMFEKAGWLDTVSFDLMIDATIDPVTVTRT
jgi:hypothetical protein